MKKHYNQLYIADLDANGIPILITCKQCKRQMTETAFSKHRAKCGKKKLIVKRSEL